MPTPSKKHPVSRQYLTVLYTLEWLAVIALLALLSLGATADESRTPFWRKTRPLSLLIPLEKINDHGLIVELLDASDEVLARQTLSTSQRNPGGWTARLNIP